MNKTFEIFDFKNLSEKSIGIEKPSKIYKNILSFLNKSFLSPSQTENFIISIQSKNFINYYEIIYLLISFP